MTINKIDLSGIERELSRIAECLEYLVAATSPPKEALEAWLPEEKIRYSYPDDEKEIITEKLAAMGKTYKESV